MLRGTFCGAGFRCGAERGSASSSDADADSRIERAGGGRHFRWLTASDSRLLANVEIPPEGIGIGVDGVLDMLRSAVNVGGDIVTAAVVKTQLNPRTGQPS